MFRHAAILVLFLFNNPVVAETAPVNQDKQYCLYKGEQYSPGSLIDMNGAKRECRDNAHELKSSCEMQAKKAEGKDQQFYCPPGRSDGSLAWRNPV